MAYPNKAADDFLRRPLTAAPMQSARRVPSAAELQADAERYVASRQAKPENLSYRTGEASAPFKQTPQPTNPSYRPAPASAPAPVTAPAVNNTFFSTGSSASRATTDKMGKVRQIVNGVYEAPKSGPGVVSRAAGAIKSGAGRVADGVKAASVGRTEGSATARVAEAAKAGYSAATAARPAAAAVEAAPAAVKATLVRRALGSAATGIGRTGAFVGRALTPAMAAYGAYKSGTMSGEDRAQFNNELGVTDSNTLGGDLANNTANTAFNIGNALTGGYAEKLGQGIGSAMGGGSFKEGWGGKTFEERTSKPDSSNAVGSMDSDTTKAPESKRDSLPRRTSAANERLEQIRQRYAAQAPGIGSVDLGAGNLNTDGFGNATNQTGMVGGGMKRNSLASSIGKFGEPVYDNDSIARMMARDAGKGGWNAKNLDRVEEATRITNRNAGGEGYYSAPQGPTAVGAAAARGEGGASARRSAWGGTGGIDGYGGDNGSFRQPRFPQAQITQGNLMGANSERKAGIANLDAAIKSLTTENGGLNMRSKRSLYGDLLRQRAEMSGKPYEVENARDMKGADQANEMARANADRALEQDKFGFEQDKYATDRFDKLNPVTKPMTDTEKAEAAQKADAAEINRIAKVEDISGKRIAMLQKNGTTLEDAIAQVTSEMQGTGVDPTGAPSLVGGEDATLKNFRGIYAPSSTKWFAGLGDEGAPAFPITADNKSQPVFNNLKDIASQDVENTSWARQKFLGAGKNTYSFKDKDGNTHKTYDDNDSRRASLEALKRRYGK